jgi:hypothetical protein
VKEKHSILILSLKNPRWTPTSVDGEKRSRACGKIFSVIQLGDERKVYQTIKKILYRGFGG